MYKIEENLGLLKQEQENQNNFNFVYKILRSGTADAAQIWGLLLRPGEFSERFVKAPIQCSVPVQRKKKTINNNSKTNKSTPNIHPETNPKRC